MTHRQRMLAAMRGEPTDRIPWAPRMDLWYIALRARDNVPERFQGMNTVEIAAELDVACHAVRADYTLPRSPEDFALRGLGMDNHPDYPFRVELDDLPVEFKYEDGRYLTTITTQAGEVVTDMRMTKDMAAGGVSLPFVERYPISSADDLEAVAQVFEHLQVVPTPDAYRRFHDRLGDSGVAVANGPLGSSPIHLMLHDLMSMEEFYVLYAEIPDKLHALSERMEPFYQAMLDASLACDAEVILWGANYDQDLTWPAFFDREIAPWLQRVADQTHAAGKLMLTHTDGENHDLLSHFPLCRFDIGESVCPTPMTRCTLAEVRAGMGPDTTVWGGLPCVILIDSSMSQDGFEAYMDTLFAEVGTGRRLILGVSDNVPPDVNLDRLDQVKQWINAFGPVGV